MIRRLTLAAFALFLAAPLAAQAPPGWTMRVDASTNPSDPDDVPEVTVASVAGGFQVNTGPAVTMWNPQNTANGAFTLRGTFTLLQPSSHRNFYGLVFGGRQLEGESQNYLYFMVAQTGHYIVIHRANNTTTHTLQAATLHDAVVRPDDSGRSVNALEVRVGASDINFVVNGQVVHSMPKSGMAANTDGIWGVRINHVLPGVVVGNLELVPGS